jgi:hypothetical protein
MPERDLRHNTEAVGFRDCFDIVEQGEKAQNMKVSSHHFVEIPEKNTRTSRQSPWFWGLF